MPAVHPFRAVQYHAGRGDLSALVAPPYDVLDAAAKARLLAKDARNVVAVDLPHTPAKELGPATAYDSAGALYRKWLADGTLARRATPAMFAYRQTTRSAAGTSQRSGMACCVDAVKFGPRPGGGILPHEETFSGPKEDRLALMKATQAQLSPIFGLHADERGKATALLSAIMARGLPDITAELGDGVFHEVWTVDDPQAINAYRDALAGEDIFIADGHHRYGTGLTYIDHLGGAALPEDHQARRSMMVLVGMSDPGLIIWPTHRVLGGMAGYSIDAFLDASKGLLDVSPAGTDIHALERTMTTAAATNVLGLYDFASGRCFTATPPQADPLRARFPDKPPAWRTLDVALVQHIVVEQVCQPRLNAGEPVKWAFPHTIDEVVEIGKGSETGAGGGKGFKAQLAVIVRPTPLDAVRDVSRANQLMPQKSTFFYPKLLTGLFINPLE